MLVHREDDGRVTAMPFVYESGEMFSVIEEMADYIAGMELVDSLWEGIAADRLRIILQQQVEIRDLTQTVALFAGGSLTEAVR